MRHKYTVKKSDEITAGSLKNKFSGKDESVIVFIDAFREHNRKVTALVGTEFST